MLNSVSWFITNEMVSQVQLNNGHLWASLTFNVFSRSEGSTGLAQEPLTAYKEGKAYSYFSCDWHKEVFLYNYISLIVNVNNYIIISSDYQYLVKRFF